MTTDEKKQRQLSKIDNIENLVRPFTDKEREFLSSATFIEYQLFKVYHVNPYDYKAYNKALESIQTVYDKVIEEIADYKKKQADHCRKVSRLRKKEVMYRAQFNDISRNQKYLWKSLRCHHKIKKLEQYSNLIDDVILHLIMAQKFIDDMQQLHLVFNIEFQRKIIREILHAFKLDTKLVQIKSHLKKIRRRIRSCKDPNRAWYMDHEKGIYGFSGKFYDPKQSFYPISEADHLFEEYFTLYKNDDGLAKFYKGMELILNNPSVSGQVLFEISEFFADKAIKKDEKAKEIFFILLSRQMFGKLYPKIFKPMSDEESKEIASRIQFFRNYSMDVFIANKKMFPNLLISIPISTIGNDNPYSTVIFHLEDLQYQYNPIDFCYLTLQIIDRLQETACMIERDLEERTSGKLTALSDHLLCVDDIIDVLVVLLLISQQIEIGHLISLYEPYVNALMLPQKFSFSFLTLSTAWKKIATTNVEDFKVQAKCIVSQSLDVEPLGIEKSAEKKSN
ncbi:hypothetical protein TVAG_481020 [Trichomonas vaginalis G3]|uniref:VPS9 domain-containing protein n=1 Tax=Trichomonas vaginalis (strain ATCC PRA-98 / G3) TaxID=412133 RepID=A2F8P8_TRIV3|nr:VPS9 domain family [Trichomonas vaginalis G3]EAX98726.1 hypothetical protein TVAG_481020 [Trichomonas vaginalis G3]KAI5538492.1 VPS9 domain family [Trichomonas vaginalis G3]|eukprot:XP_001311656.1 hypothetical protein [Trichomonas vaginalis G3]